MPLTDLRGRRLDARFFNRRLADVIRDILFWMGDPETTRERMDSVRWDALCAEAQSQLDFNPEADADVDAGAKLAKGAGRWAEVWSRFCEAPGSFPGIADLLERSRPAGVLHLEDRDRWPDLNKEDEKEVRDALAGLPELSRDAALEKALQLEQSHGPRRGWVWAKLGWSPFAQVLRPLARLAEAVETSMGGATRDDMARTYCDRGWKADRNAREALALSPAGHEPTIRKAVRHLIRPWMEESARELQRSWRDFQERQATGQGGAKRASLSEEQDNRPASATARVAAEEGECILFVDGLRYEVGRCLEQILLEEYGLESTVRSRWAAVPTVTATAKPAVTPVAERVAGDHLGADFLPVMRGRSQSATTAVLDRAIEQEGYELDKSDRLPLAPEAGARGWFVFGRIDHNGHHLGSCDFAQSVEREVEKIAARVSALIESGWKSVRIVTDHGWLLLPDGLPMTTLPRHLTESKWARCAVVAAGADPDQQLWDWHWNRRERFASPPGISCFSQRPEYAHGGISVQECLTPDIRVRADADGAGRIAIRSVSWRQMRCDVQAEGATGMVADLRLAKSLNHSVSVRPKAIDSNGRANLILDESYEEDHLVVVIIGPDRRILAQRTTLKGAVGK